MKKTLAAIATAALSVCAGTAHANLIVDPNVGLTDFVFNFNGVGSSVTWSGQDKLEITVGSPTSFKVQVEDCCVLGDSWSLEIDGVTVPWGATQGGDGVPNGGAFFGPAGNYFEALSQIVFTAGTHTIDMTQVTGIPGGAWINLSAGETVVPIPGTLSLLGLGLLGIAASRRRSV